LILDSSAIIALICNEEGADRLLGKLGDARVIAIGAPTVAESQLALSVKLGRDSSALVEQLLAEIRAQVVPFGREHISAFFAAYLHYGKGRHPARLNMGDCFTYATAKVAGMPVLFTGDDFSRTDLEAA
jgi:ribonuclease VapC